jgi:hypothetical protein
LTVIAHRLQFFANGEVKLPVGIGPFFFPQARLDNAAATPRQAHCQGMDGRIGGLNWVEHARTP